MKGRVLIVDDDPVALGMIEGALMLGEFEVIRASNAEDALSKVRRGMTDLVLTDLEMPTINGVQLIAMIRDDPSLRTTPIIAVSAHTEEFIAQNARRAGCVTFISKPFSPQHLIQQVRQRLGLSHEPTELPARPRLDIEVPKMAPPPVATPLPADEMSINVAAGADDKAIFDRATFLEYMDGSLEYAQRAIGVLLSTTPHYLRKIRNAIVSEDADMLRVSAHTLKGAVAFFAAPAVIDFAFQLETMGQARDITKAPWVYFELERAFARLLPALDEIVRPVGSPSSIER